MGFKKTLQSDAVITKHSANYYPVYLTQKRPGPLKAPGVRGS